MEDNKNTETTIIFEFGFGTNGNILTKDLTKAVKKYFLVIQKTVLPALNLRKLPISVDGKLLSIRFDVAGECLHAKKINFHKPGSLVPPDKFPSDEDVFENKEISLFENRDGDMVFVGDLKELNSEARRKPAQKKSFLPERSA